MVEFTDRIKIVGESPTFALERNVDELEKQGRNIIRFGIGQPDFNTPNSIKEAGKKAIDDNKTKYTASSGIKELKEAVVIKLKENNLDYIPENILVGNGAKQVLYNIMQVLIDKNDEVLIPKPYWVSYIEQVKLANGKPVIVDYKDDLKIDFNHLKKNITKSTKLLILNSPNNPTGAVYTKEELQEIAEICIKNNIHVISDEVYEKFIYEDIKHYSIASFNEKIKKLTITVNAVSKTYAMTGWRIGYCAAEKEIIKQMTKLQDQSTSNPCTISQYAALEALKGDQESVEEMRKEYEKRRNYIYERLKRIKGIECALPKGAFYIFPKISNFFNDKIKNSLEFAQELLEKANIAVVPGNAFGDDDYIRISYATPIEKIKEGMNRFENYINENY